jgi:plasmid stability protein
MSTILIRDLPADTHAALKRLAEAHRRSLQQELHAILAQAAAGAPSDVRLSEPLELYFAKPTSKRKSKGTWSREDIYGDEGR